MKLREQLYTVVTTVCLLWCGVILGHMALEEGRAAMGAVHRPPQNLEHQLPEPDPEADPTLQTGPVLLDETALSAQIAKLLPRELGLRDLAVAVTGEGLVKISGSLGRDGLLGWLKGKGWDSGAMTALRVLLPERVGFALTLRADRQTLALEPVTAALGGVEVTMPKLPAPVTEAVGEAFAQAVAQNALDLPVSFTDGGLMLG